MLYHMYITNRSSMTIYFKTRGLQVCSVLVCLEINYIPENWLLLAPWIQIDIQCGKLYRSLIVTYNTYITHISPMTVTIYFKSRDSAQVRANLVFLCNIWVLNNCIISRKITFTCAIYKPYIQINVNCI